MLKCTFSDSCPRNSNSVGLGWSPGICVFNTDPQMISMTRFRNTNLYAIHAAHLELGFLQKHNEPGPRPTSSKETLQPTKLPGHCSANALILCSSCRLVITPLLIASMSFTEDLARLPSLHPTCPATLLMAWITTWMTQTTLQPQLLDLLH